MLYQEMRKIIIIQTYWKAEWRGNKQRAILTTWKKAREDTDTLVSGKIDFNTKNITIDKVLFQNDKIPNLLEVKSQFKSIIYLITKFKI